MATPDFELQVAIVTRLKAYAPLQALIGSSVFDLPTSADKLPYVSIGEADLRRVDVACKESAEINISLHGWSDKPGYSEVKRIASAVAQALHHYPLPVAGFRLLSIDHTNTRTFRDRDGLTSHSVIEFMAYTEAL